MVEPPQFQPAAERIILGDPLTSSDSGRRRARHRRVSVSSADSLFDEGYASNCCEVYYGAISNIGILLWCVTSAVCLFAALILWLERDKSRYARRLMPALFAAGLFNGWMTLDDMFLLHERILPALGIPQVVVYATYALLTVFYLIGARHFILSGPLSTCVMAIGLLSLSVVFDVFETDSYLNVLIEDGAKFLGIAAWTVFHVLAAIVVVHSLSKNGFGDEVHSETVNR